MARKISVQFLDKKTGKIRMFQAKVRQPKYASTDKMIKGMNASGMHPAMIIQAVMKREKIGKVAAKKHVIKTYPKFEKQLNARKSVSKSKKRKSTRVSRRNNGGARTLRKSRW